MMQRNLAEVARSYIGTPFHHQGRLPGVGLDCAGVVVCAAKECRVIIEDQQNYASTPTNGMLERAVVAHCESIQLADVMSGDLMLFRFLREPQHLAVYDSGMLIHAYSAVGKVVLNSFDSAWRKRLVGCYRLRGANNVT